MQASRSCPTCATNHYWQRLILAIPILCLGDTEASLCCVCEMYLIIQLRAEQCWLTHKLPERQTPTIPVWQSQCLLQRSVAKSAFPLTYPWATSKASLTNNVSSILNKLSVYYISSTVYYTITLEMLLMDKLQFVESLAPNANLVSMHYLLNCLRWKLYTLSPMLQPFLSTESIHNWIAIILEYITRTTSIVYL